MRLVRDVKRGNTTQMVANVGKIQTMTSAQNQELKVKWMAWGFGRMKDNLEETIFMVVTERVAKELMLGERSVIP